MKVLFLTTLLFTILSACNTPNSPGSGADSTTANTDTVPVELKDHVEYYENGQVKITGKMADGKREGPWKSYYLDGKKWSETTFKNGIKSGPTVTYYENGMMRYRGQYEGDKRTGVWQFYNEEGTLEKTLDLSSEVPESAGEGAAN